jgi:hypothetical protein
MAIYNDKADFNLFQEKKEKMDFRFHLLWKKTRSTFEPNKGNW